MSLKGSRLGKAVRYNRHHKHEIGWTIHFKKLANVLGLSPNATDERGFAMAVETWQHTQPSLKKDGMLGARSWARLRPLLKNAVPVSFPVPGWVMDRKNKPAPSMVQKMPSGGFGRAWMRIAEAEYRDWSRAIDAENIDKTDKDNPPDSILDFEHDYFKASPMWGGKVHAAGVRNPKTDVEWCAAFVNFCLHRAGFSHTGSAGAGSFLRPRLWDYTCLKKPEVGCVIVLGDGKKPKHIGFLASTDGLPEADGKGPIEIPHKTGVRLLGGNQSGRVKYSTYRGTGTTSRTHLMVPLGGRGFLSPYLRPENRGGGECNMHVPTAAPHRCGYNHP